MDEFQKILNEMRKLNDLITKSREQLDILLFDMAAKEIRRLSDERKIKEEQK